MEAALRWMAYLPSGLLALAFCGCITPSTLFGKKDSPTIDTRLLETQGYSIPPGGMPSPVALDPSDGPRIVLEVRHEGKHLEAIPLPMDRAVFIEDIVQQAKLHERLGNLQISIMRPNGSDLPPVRLQVETDKKGQAKQLTENYALLPGDHIIVINDGRSAFERFVDDKVLQRKQ